MTADILRSQLTHLRVILTVLSSVSLVETDIIHLNVIHILMGNLLMASDVCTNYHSKVHGLRIKLACFRVAPQAITYLREEREFLTPIMHQITQTITTVLSEYEVHRILPLSLKSVLKHLEVFVHALCTALWTSVHHVCYRSLSTFASILKHCMNGGVCRVIYPAKRIRREICACAKELAYDRALLQVLCTLCNFITTSY